MKGITLRARWRLGRRSLLVAVDWLWGEACSMQIAAAGRAKNGGSATNQEGSLNFPVDKPLGLPLQSIFPVPCQFPVWTGLGRNNGGGRNATHLPTSLQLSVDGPRVGSLILIVVGSVLLPFLSSPYPAARPHRRRTEPAWLVLLSPTRQAFSHSVVGSEI
jgi:hypothetical protein